LHIAILGLGYVGATTAACLTKAGHHVYGVDISAEKVRAIGDGRSPVVEPGVEDLLQAAVRDGRLQAGTSLEPWLDLLDLVVICVGTPSRADGKLDLSHLLTVSRELGRAVRARRPGLPPLLLVFRSTVPPGTTERLVLPTLAQSAGEGPGRLYDVAFNPEFLRESTAVKDYFAPPKIVIGEREPGVSGRLRGMYEGIEAPLFEVPFAVAETVKFADNCWHAVKVAFGNEIGRLCLARGVDPQAVADIFLSDTKLNVSPTYLRPGGPFGGSCLPKDLSGMLALARDAGLSVPLLAGAKESNAVHLAWIFQEVRHRCPPPGPVLLVGLSFKTGTDDLRNSPNLDLAELLLEAGYELHVHDPDLDPARLTGVNFALALEHQEALRTRLTDGLPAAAEKAQLAVIGKPVPGIRERLPASLPVLDLTRLAREPN
jgi:GDP-mannose 6-dehydrogenase